MKAENDKPRKSKKFLKLPSYPGGKAAFLRFIEENIRYPEEALHHLIEGTVYLEYTVDNIGVVGDIHIIHGLGYGCDEEAMRLISILKYNPEKNRGIRMKTRMKSRIRFELPAHLKPAPSIQLNYSSPSKKPQTDSPTDPGTNYGYTITFD